MSSKTPLIATTSVLLALALGFGWHGVISAAKSEEDLAVLDQKLARLSASAQQAEALIARRSTETTALKAKLQRIHTTMDAQIAAAASNPATAKNPAVLLASDPSLHALFLQSFRANLAPRFGTMYQSLGLTPAQIDKFEDLATAQADDSNYIKAAAVAQGIRLPDPGVTALQKQSLDQYYATVAAEVSPAASQQAMQLDRMQGVQTLVDDINSMVEQSSPHFTAAQSAQLLQVLASSSSNYQNGGSVVLDSVDWNSVDWDAASKQAASLMSESQLQAFNAEAQFFRIIQKAKQFYAQRQASK